jgi:hypothetical protein
VQVLSGDRAGVLACGGIENALRARIKLSVGSNQSGEVQADDLIQQAFKLTQGASLVQATLIRCQSSTPPFIYRLEAMLQWAGLPSSAESEAAVVGRGR